MFIDDLFSIVQQTRKEEEILAHIRVNKGHDIFKGHFPENPVVPGVCMIQLVIDLVDQHTNQETLIDQASSVKFLRVWNPNQVNEVWVSIRVSKSEKDITSINATIFVETVTFLKLTATLTFC